MQARKITQFSKQEIDQLWQRVQRVFKGNALVLFKTSSLGKMSRILIIISRKIGSAPVRNKLRRQIKAIFYENNIHQKGNDWILLTKKPITELSFQELKDILLMHF